MKIMFRKKPKSKGQAIVEMVLLLLVVALISVLIIWFGFAYSIKHMLLTAARYGTDMIAYTDQSATPASRVKEMVTHYLTHQWIVGLRLNPDRLTINVEDNRYPRITHFCAAWRPINFQRSSVEVSFRFDTPRMFTVFGANVPPHITITERSEVIAGTGAPL